ncbi:MULTISPECIES: DNA primase [unclassified Granulicatella]|uniref:DNA primase n=1 Tax=unclassified Granulicatella TaxID=2630493 RepID=UPI001073B934|nr:MULTISPECIES: DNA primase [unclassified Granulicatella]MBF0779474.1 DNA primase [Granulicatella sp. 19428wC4_WM01]TFU96442.1 DNA primase [Granulicatella sp. WM01]
MINSEKYIENIPQDLKNHSQWLWFKRIVNVDKHGMEKVIKIPVSPITLKSNFWNQKENWADFETAVNNMKSSGCDGLSFVLSKDDPLVCIDLDNVDNKKLEIFITDFNDTYIEISQSGRGLHIFVKGKIEKNFNNQLEKVEMYQENRCIAMTGNVYKFNDFVANKVLLKQKELDKYYKLFSPKKSVREVIRKYQEAAECVPDSDTVLETMCRYNAKAKALFEGSYTSGDASKDDFGLIFFLNSFTHGNEEMIKEIFLQSALNRIDDRSKRRTEEGYLRYLDESINKAIKKGCGQYWDHNYYKNKGGYALE